MRHLHAGRYLAVLGIPFVGALALWALLTATRTVIQARHPSPVTGAITFGERYLPGQGAGLTINRHGNSRIDTRLSAIFGPDICILYGDPFTPENPWVERPYSYRFRIIIPADYEVRAGTDRLRIELLDPDSINAPVNEIYTITHTEIFANANPSIGLTEPGSNGGARHNAYLESSCEWEDQLCRGIIGFELDAINPFWFVRIDENRGVGPGNGNGNCGGPDGGYQERYNTELNFRLVYPRVDDNIVQTVELASYSGQTADPLRDYDSFSHGTDLRWVSPGGYNVNGPVPTDCGSLLGGYSLPGGDINNDGIDDTRCIGAPFRPVDSAGDSPAGFELDLATALPNSYTDPDTGARILLLEVQGLSGASENNFSVWAGPPDRAAPAGMNLRNVAVIDDGIMDPAGVSIEAINVAGINFAFAHQVDHPLLALDERYAGETILFSLYDPDSGTAPPISFLLDTIDSFSLDFASQGCWGNGGCNGQWVGPPGNPDTGFEIPIPESFVTGTLMTNFATGSQDTVTMIVTLPTLTYSPTQIALQPASPTATIAYAGHAVVVVLDVANQGGEVGRDMVVRATVPAGFSLAAAAADNLTAYQPDASVLAWQLDDLAMGQSGTLSLTFSIDSSLPVGATSLVFGLTGANDSSTDDNSVTFAVWLGAQLHMPVARQADSP